MGRLFTCSGTFALNPEETLATFEAGTVYSAKISFAPGGSTLMYYESFREGARIYRSTSSGLPNQLAWCDKFGRIEANGKLLGYCENGEVKDSSGRTIAYYEGDGYGAAAAACAVLFSLSDADRSENTNYHTGTQASDSSGSPAASSGSGDNDVSFLFVLFAGIGMALLGIVKLLWKGIKTLPFWGPYGFSVLLPLLMVLIMMPSTAVVMVPAVGAIVGFSLPLYLVLHTVLLIKCKKRQEKGKYWPIYISFALFVLGFTIALCVPAVIYQIVWLVRDKKKQTGGAESNVPKRDSTE